ncbi:hypothetical protein [Streptomyces eurythermus]|uniref:hypothetical protein n=1 Tax=Streptomyces eurythermus TaxID=42237 RepID=UPI0036F9BA59
MKILEVTDKNILSNRKVVGIPPVIGRTAPLDQAGLARARGGILRWPGSRDLADGFTLQRGKTP